MTNFLVFFYKYGPLSSGDIFVLSFQPEGGVLTKRLVTRPEWTILDGKFSFSRPGNGGRLYSTAPKSLLEQ